MLGSQETFIKFKYFNDWFQTTVKKEAGRYPEWNESFKLEDFRSAMGSVQTIVFEAWD